MKETKRMLNESQMDKLARTIEKFTSEIEGNFHITIGHGLFSQNCLYITWVKERHMKTVIHEISQPDIDYMDDSFLIARARIISNEMIQKNK